MQLEGMQIVDKESKFVPTPMIESGLYQTPK